eukprot:Gregarina_sp_Poly_1__6513@NODE_348_length_9346_cov_198_894493_g291_i0_p4_GENE_NODE_348_length_9346_cov_198_894493_g291_i0NODE_348_length_9346_cov_198_894493_g291_i0_p4_ORF_typecomplete_len239_score44_22Npun_R1517/PF18068_1/1_2e04Npun_R1517/PF18068_1/0_081PH_4/PF15404_6/0_16Cnd1/PF12717_7/0_15HA/PF03457_14/0_28_NODE_348_length_9346_cov_198_894493_g291_i028793595
MQHQEHSTDTSAKQRPEHQAPASAYVDYLEVLASKWSSSSAAAHITPQLLEYLQPRFHRCSTPIKIRVVLSFLYLSEESRLENRETLLKVLAEAEVDRDEWVRKLARLVSSFVVVGSIDVRETDSETAYHLLKFLNTQREKHNLIYLNKPPLEAPHLANVLSEKVMRSECMADTEERAPSEDLFDGFLQRSRVCADTTNFQPKIDFLAFNAELMRAGELAMRKTYKKQQSDGRQKGPH